MDGPTVPRQPKPRRGGATRNWARACPCLLAFRTCHPPITNPGHKILRARGALPPADPAPSHRPSGTQTANGRLAGAPAGARPNRAAAAESSIAVAAAPTPESLGPSSATAQLSLSPAGLATLTRRAGPGRGPGNAGRRRDRDGNLPGCVRARRRCPRSSTASARKLPEHSAGLGCSRSSRGGWCGLLRARMPSESADRTPAGLPTNTRSAVAGVRNPFMIQKTSSLTQPVQRLGSFPGPSRSDSAAAAV